MNYPLSERQRAMLLEMGIAIGPVEHRSDPAKPTQRSPTPWSASPPPTSPTLPTQGVEPSRTGRAGAAGPCAGPSFDALPWPALVERASSCTDCALGQTRQRSVWGVFLNGDSASAAQLGIDLLIVTDPPDETAENAGHPLGLPSGSVHQLVENMVAAMGRAASGALPLAPRVFVTNLTKCRLPVGESLDVAHVQACRRYIDQTLALLRPKLMVAMGRSAGLALLADSPDSEAPAPLGRLRGQVRSYRSTPWIATYTPQFLLRNTKEKAKAWEDLCLGLAALTQTHPA